MQLLHCKLPPQAVGDPDAVRAAAAKAHGGDMFVAMFIESPAQTRIIQPILMAARAAAKMAVKAVRGDLPVGVSSTMAGALAPVARRNAP